MITGLLLDESINGCGCVAPFEGAKVGMAISSQRGVVMGVA